MRPGKFLLSFDCEGKWGMVDCLSPRHRQLYTTANLEATYRTLTSLLRKHGIDATFAFTSAFCLTADRFGRLRPEIERLGAGAEAWFGPAFQAIDADEGEGWFAPACFDAVRTHDGHEIASHGFSHLPWQAPYATRQALDAELALCRRIPAFGADAVRTFVFPRNQVAHQDLLLARGFVGYRGARPSMGRLVNFASEFNLRTRSEDGGAEGGAPMEIPAGYFLNWRYGLRRGVPAALTVQRWRNIIRHAARSGGVVHAWTHPENFLDGHEMFPMLDEILRFVAEMREAGRLEVLTNTQYIARARGEEAPRARAAQPARSVAPAARPSREAPLVSIGMPVFNGGPALHVAVRSVLAQTMPDWELLLIDDGSTDGEPDAVAALGDPRIRVVRDGCNKGLSVRLNETIDMARGRYFARMDHDDICHPDRLRAQVAALEARPDIDLLASRCLRVSDGLRFTGYMPFAQHHEDICRRPWLRIPMVHPSWMGRLEWFRRFRYPDPAPYYAEDFELLLRACDTSRFAALPDVLLAYRVRNRIELKKSLRARLAQHRLQRGYFRRKGQPAGMAMASGTFLLRVGSDGCRAAAQWAGIAATPQGMVDRTDAAEWSRIIAQFAPQARAGDPLP